MHRELKGLRKESAILLRIQSHPNIIQLIGVCENPRKYTLLLEYIDGGCLSEVLRSADPSIESWANRLDVAKQIAQGMAHLHSQSPPVFHLDLKPQNVLLKKANNAYTCKITDFGLSRMRGISIGSRTSRHSTYSTDSIPSGTVLYIAPERYNSTESTARPLLLAKADVYSFGVILWEIKERKQPFQNEPLTAVLHQRVKLGNGIPPGFAWAPAGYGSLQQNSSARDPCDRPTFFDIVAHLQDIITMQVSQDSGLGGRRERVFFTPTTDEHQRKKTTERKHRPLQRAKKNSLSFQQTANLSFDEGASKWEIPEDKITMKEKTGSGYFGEVFKAAYVQHTAATGSILVTVAVKRLKDNHSKDARKSIYKEIQVLARLPKHRNVISMFGFCTQPNWIVLEYAEYGDLRSYLKSKGSCHMQQVQLLQDSGLSHDSNEEEEKEVAGYGLPFSEWQMLDYAHQVASGMSHLINNNYIHGDLAARNVLVCGGMQLKISDFGLSRYLQYSEYCKRQSQGVIPFKWAAPESLRDNIFGEYSDVWSFGIVLWEITTLGGTPYPGILREKLYQLLTTSSYHMAQPRLCPDSLYELMTLCWNDVPDRRPRFRVLQSKIGNVLKKIDSDFQMAETRHPTAEKKDSGIEEDYKDNIDAITGCLPVCKHTLISQFRAKETAV
eukprot:m.106574 g.106574  ORF g.106574 m.106574 type:complete len:668 (+) comp37262_c0_seq36:536-2539(+)